MKWFKKEKQDPLAPVQRVFHEVEEKVSFSCPYCFKPVKVADVLFRNPRNVSWSIDHAPGPQKEGFAYPVDRLTESADEQPEPARREDFWPLGFPNTENKKLMAFLRRFWGGRHIIQTHTVYRWKESGEPTETTGVRVKSWGAKGLPAAIRVKGSRHSEEDDTELLTETICPECGCTLPEGYVNAPGERVKLLALAGGSGAGKTQYIISVFQELMSEKTRDSNDLARYADIEVSRESAMFLDAWGEGFASHGAIPVTNIAGEIFPVVMTVRPFSGKEGGQPLSFYVSVFDVAGEIAINKENIDLAAKQKSFLHSRDLMLIIDPHQFYASSIDLPSYARHCGTKLKVLLQNLGYSRFFPELERVLAVVAKADLLMQAPDPLWPSRTIIHEGMVAYESSLSPGHAKGVDLALCNKLSRQISDMLDKADASTQKEAEENRRKRATKVEIQQTLWKESKPWRERKTTFFSVSTYARNDRGGRPTYENVVTAGGQRIRLLEPLLYLFCVWNIIPEKK